jgi:hypothetical protein
MLAPCDICRNTQFGVCSTREELSERDASATLAFVSELKELDEPSPFPPRLLAELGKLIPSDRVAYSELNPVTRSSIVLVAWRNGGGGDEITWGNRLRRTYGGAFVPRIPSVATAPRATTGRRLSRRRIS